MSLFYFFFSFLFFLTGINKCTMEDFNGQRYLLNQVAFADVVMCRMNIFDLPQIFGEKNARSRRARVF